MAMIKCPICGNEISDKSESCIYCGNKLEHHKLEVNKNNNVKDIVVSQTDKTAIAPIPQKIEAYDVLLIESCSLKSKAKAELSNILNIKQTEADDILNQIPCFLYEGIVKSDAELLASRLVKENFRVAVYDFGGNVRYFEPELYLNRPLPKLVPAPRKRKLVIPNYSSKLSIRPITMPNKTPVINAGLKTRKIKISK